MAERIVPKPRPATLADIPDAELDRIAAMGFDWVWLRSVWQTGLDRNRLLAAVNYAPNQSQFYVRLPFPDLNGSQWRLQDQMGTATYNRVGKDLRSHGLYVDTAPWGYHVFSLQKLT